MKQATWMLVAVAAVSLLAGCQPSGYSSQPLGQVSYVQAFGAGQAALGRHFAIESADPAEGTITGKPKSFRAGRDRLLGDSPAQRLATMRITQKGDQVYAEVRVSIQRQDVEALRHMRPVTVDNELPGRTPAQESAAVTANQDQAWQTTARDEALERAILNDLVNALAGARRVVPITPP